MEPEGSLPYSQVPATRPYPDPTPSSPHEPQNIHIMRRKFVSPKIVPFMRSSSGAELPLIR
jgi:hypothetical protein